MKLYNQLLVEEKMDGNANSLSDIGALVLLRDPFHLVAWGGLECLGTLLVGFLLLLGLMASRTLLHNRLQLL